MKAIIAMLIVGSPLVACLGAQFSVTPLTAPAGGTFVSVNGISSYGVVGDDFVGGDLQPVIWQAGVSTLLPLPAGYRGSTRINSNGDVGGYVWTTNVNVSQPVVWRNGQMNLLDTLNMPGGSVTAINDAGDAVGSVNDLLNNSGPQGVAVLWSGNQATVVGNFPTMISWAESINSQGQILIAVSSDHVETWVWSSGQLTQIPAFANRTLGASKMNDLGHVTGSAYEAGVNDAIGFLWTGGATVPLANLSSDLFGIPAAINSSDQIVGEGGDLLGNEHAILWENGQVFNLNDLIPADSGWTLTAATAIGDDGSIGGYGFFNGNEATFLLTPAGADANVVVPEAGTVGMLVAGCVGLLRRRRR